MKVRRDIFGKNGVTRTLALVACLAMLYLAAGGAALHQHTNGPDTPCHICQSVHIPALAAARIDLIPEAKPVAWHSSLPEHNAPTDSFDLQRASRAPPVA